MCTLCIQIKDKFNEINVMATTQYHVFIWSSVLALIGCVAVTSSSNNQDNNQEVVFGLIIDGENNGRAAAMVEKAVDDVNRRSDLLTNFRLKSLPLSVDPTGECNEGSVLTGLFSHLLNSSSHRIIALIGSGCSKTIEAITKISGYHNITLISCASSSDELSDRVRFPYYFQLLPSEVNLARVFYSIIKEYGWRRVALIVQNEHRYRETTKSLKTMFMSVNKDPGEAIECVEKVFDTEDDGLTAIEDNLFEELNARIFVAAMDSKFARQLICLAYRFEVKYPKHLFLTYGNYETNWWTVEDANTPIQCTAEQRAVVLQFSLAALHYNHLPINYSFEACQLHDSLRSYYECYDSILTFSLGLNKTIEEINTNSVINRKAREQTGIQNSDSFDISEFNYNVSVVADLMKMFLGDVQFNGESGPVQFDVNGIREATNMMVLQYRTTYVNGTPFLTQAHSSCNSSSSATLDQRLKLLDVAFVRENGSRLDFPDDYTRDDIWPSLTPHDGMVKTDKATVILPVAVILILFNIGGLVFSVACLVFNLVYRNRKLIRLSSPNLNYLIIAGTVLVYSSGVAFALPLLAAPAVTAFCFLRTWLLAFGFTCGFAPIVAKLWRVYYIFRNPQATKRKSGIQDWHLMIFVFSLLVMNAILMALHVLLEGLVANFNVAQIPNMEIPFTIQGELEIQVNYLVYQCSSHLWIRYLVLALIYGYMVLLQISALYFAFQTRKVKVKGLSDSKYIALIVYTVGILVLINSITTFALPEYVTVYAAVYVTCIWISATAVLGLMFIPKMMRLYKDPRGETVFTAHEEALQITNAIGGHSQNNEEVASLRKKIKRLENTIVEYKRLTGVTFTKGNRMTTSISMINLCASSHIEEKGETEKRTSKVIFEFPSSNLSKHNDDSNNCEAILENVLYSDND